MADAFTAGVEPGGLLTDQEIKILLCYMLYTVHQPMKHGEVTDILVGAGMANYFNIEEAIAELIRLGHFTEDTEQRIATTATGNQIGSTLSVRVPYTLRERSVQAALRLLKRREIEQENPVEISRTPEGITTVTCRVMDENVPMMSVTLRVADDMQAKEIKEHFLKDPSLLYRSVLAILTGDAGVRFAGTQIYIDI